MRPRLSDSNVVATIALFIALGRGAYAAIDLVGRNDSKSKHTAKDARRARTLPRRPSDRPLAAATATSAASAATADDAAR